MLEISMQETFMKESIQMVILKFLHRSYLNSCKITLFKMLSFQTLKTSSMNTIRVVMVIFNMKNFWILFCQQLTKVSEIIVYMGEEFILAQTDLFLLKLLMPQSEFLKEKTNLQLKEEKLKTNLPLFQILTAKDRLTELLKANCI